jgi:hypothetical protein
MALAWATQGKTTAAKSMTIALRTTAAVHALQDVGV